MVRSQSFLSLPEFGYDNQYFEKSCTLIKVPPDIRTKAAQKHKVNEEEIEDALSDPFWVIRRFDARKPQHRPWNRPLEGDPFEIPCESESGRLFQFRGRFYFPGTGHFQVFTILAGEEISQQDRYYHAKEKEELMGDG